MILRPGRFIGLLQNMFISCWVFEKKKLVYCHVRHACERYLAYNLVNIRFSKNG